MKTASRLLTLALLAVLGSVSAQSIDTVTGDGADPSMGSLGTTLTIAGTGLGGPTGLGKPSAFLQDPLTLKKFALKVLTFSDTEITALIAKAAYGTLDVSVQPKGGALLTLDDAFTVPQPEVTGVLPGDEKGTIGTTVTVSGTGLFGVAGMSKPKVQLFHAVTGKKYSLKVLTFSDTEVTATITKAVAGTLELQLIPKGGAALVASAAFEVPLPNILDITPAFAFVNDTVTLDCEHVGNKQPKVKLGSKSCKVVTFSDTLVTFLMPKKLPKGVQTLQLINKVGTATQIGAVINQGDVPDTATDTMLVATVGKTKFAAGSANDFLNLFAIFGAYDDTPSPEVTLTGRFYDPITDDQVSGFTLIAPFDPNAFTDPVAFVDAAGGKVEFEIADPDALLFDPPLGTWSSDEPTGAYTLTILSVDPPDVDGLALIRGAFTGTLYLAQGVGNGKDPYAVSNGEFRCLVDIDS